MSGTVTLDPIQRARLAAHGIPHRLFKQRQGQYAVKARQMCTWAA
jgi:hypothetical protein